MSSSHGVKFTEMQTYIAKLANVSMIFGYE